MVKRLLDRFRASKADPVEEKLRGLFGFLMEEYGFQFARNELGDAVDPDTGKLWFYGPYNAYSIFNREICINILHLVQRDDYQIFITDTYRAHQAHMLRGRAERSEYAYHLDRYADYIRECIEQNGELYGTAVSPVK